MIENDEYTPPEAETFAKKAEFEHSAGAFEQGQEFIDQLGRDDAQSVRSERVISVAEKEQAEKDRKEYVRNGYIFWGGALAAGSGLIVGANRLSEEFLAPLAEKMSQVNPDNLVLAGAGIAVVALSLEMGARANGASLFFPYRR